MSTKWFVASMFALAIGCSDDTNEKVEDVADAGAEVDSGVESDATTGCGDACEELGLELTFADQQVAFERAYFGVTSPRNSTRDRWEIYVEAYAGGADGCPSEQSPTPAQTLIIAGVSFPDDATVSSDATGLAVSLLDFTGDLTMAPIESAKGEEATFVDGDVCKDCEEGSSWITFELDAPFTVETASSEGSAIGQVYATHCPSLDAL